MTADADPLHVRWYGAIGAKLTELRDADVVICVLPEGEEHLVKGEGYVLPRTTGERSDVIVIRLPILSLTMLKALRHELRDEP